MAQFPVNRIPLNIVETICTVYEHDKRGSWSASGAPRKSSALSGPQSLPFDTSTHFRSAGFVNPYMAEYPTTDFGQKIHILFHLSRIEHLVDHLAIVYLTFQYQHFTEFQKKIIFYYCLFF